MAAAAPRLAALAAGLLAVASQACEFRAPGHWRLAFGTLQPASGQTVRTTALAPEPAGVGNCPAGTSMQIGILGSESGAGGPLRLRHEAGQGDIAYRLELPSLLVSPGAGRFVPLPPITGEIAGPAYRDAAPGHYRDTVILQVTP